VESTAATSGTLFYKPHLGKWWHSEKQIYSQSVLLCDLNVRMQKSWHLLAYIICSCLIHITAKINPF